MQIIVCGCWSTATTPLFNIVRLVCEHDGPTYAVEAGKYDYESGFDCAWQIVKTHKFNPAWLEWASPLPGVVIHCRHDLKKFYSPRRLIFYTDREEKDTLASMRRFKATGGIGNRANPENALRGERHTKLYAEHAILKTPFVYFEKDQKTRMLIDRIRIILNIQCKVNEIFDQFKAIKPPREGVDPVTLLHKNHITK